MAEMSGTTPEACKSTSPEPSPKRKKDNLVQTSFYFFNSKRPFVEKQKHDSIPMTFPSNVVADSSNRKGHFQWIVQNKERTQAIYCFEYNKPTKKIPDHSEVKPASSVTMEDIPRITWKEMALPECEGDMALVCKSDFDSVTYEGMYSFVFSSTFAACIQNVVVAHNNQNWNELAQTIDHLQSLPQPCTQPYNRAPELHKTRCLVFALKTKLGNNFVIEEQTALPSLYSEFNAKVDLTIRRKDKPHTTLVANVGGLEANVGLEELEANMDEPTTFTSEYKLEGSNYARTVAGMVCMATENAVHNYLRHMYEFTRIVSYGISFDGKEAALLILTLDLISRCSTLEGYKGLDITDTFNYALNRL